MSEYLETNVEGQFEGYNEDAIYLYSDWMDPNAYTYVESGLTGPIGGGGNVELSAAASKPFTTIAWTNGYATVRANRQINFEGSIPFNGKVSGSVPAGSIFRGRDDNNNGLPDILEKQIKKGTIWFSGT